MLQIMAEAKEKAPQKRLSLQSLWHVLNTKHENIPDIPTRALELLYETPFGQIV